jgi:hypothetical protein
MKLSKGNWSLSIRKWHSINLVPMVSCYSICHDDDYRISMGRCFQITIFGIIIDLVLPFKELDRMYSTGVRGPLYSRARQKWYRANNILDEY